MDIRPRRLRRTQSLRRLVCETALSSKDFIYPIFVVEGEGIEREIPSLTGQYHYSVDRLSGILERVKNAGIEAVLLFGLPDERLKNETGDASALDDGVVQRAIRFIKTQFPEITIITDVCLCAYTTHGHCGPITQSAVDNDLTLKYIGQMAVSHARAGADVIAPSGMMDGMVRSLRKDLDAAGFSDQAILSYSVKYASSFYGPFRGAAGSSPQIMKGELAHRKTYQMDPGNRKEALREALLDVQEGADMLMVKPGLLYLDVISDLAKQVEIPIVAYHVSGEFMMIKAAERLGLLDGKAAMQESLIALKRSGADLIISYAALELLE